MFQIRNINTEEIYSSFRAENKTPFKVAVNLWRYLLKYFLHKTRYSENELIWADKVNSICKYFLKKRKKENGLKIGFAGDIMWVRKEDDSMVAADVLERMGRCDFWAGNLETPLIPEDKVRNFWPDYLRYGSSARILNVFQKNGGNMFGLVSLANNHSRDRGDAGINTTIKYLNDKGILYSGLNEDFCIKEIKNIRIGFYAMTYNVNLPEKNSAYLINLMEDPSICLERARKILKKMDEENVDLKILSLHWGHEFEFIPSTEQRRLAMELVIAGADIITGHHPHVIQPMEILFSGGYEKSFDIPVDSEFCIESGTKKKALIMYSLGNFSTDMVTKSVRKGMGVVLEIFKTGQNIEWQFDDIFYTENIRSGLFTPHRIRMSEDEFPCCCEHISHKGKSSGPEKETVNEVLFPGHPQ